MKVVSQQYERYLGTNPYKGLVPFIGTYDFSCSMEFFYIPLKSIILNYNTYSWYEMEKNIASIYQRGHKSIIRVYLDYPAKNSGIPNYLKSKIMLVKYEEFGGGFSPNYNNDFLIQELLKFIKKFGERYDGDDRIAFIECGLVGHWGEWHTWPNDFLMPSIEQQEKIIYQYSKSFRITKLLFRYPKYEYLKKYKIGFHDDSFCFSTLSEFVKQMRKNDLSDVYLEEIIGGEVRPEEQENLTKKKSTKEDYMECVKNTHVSWLVCQGLFENCNDSEYIKELSSKLGYDFYVDGITIKNNIISFNLINIGVAPIYYNCECYLIFSDNEYILLDYDLRKLGPNQKHNFQYKMDVGKISNKISFMIRDSNGQLINLSNKYKNINGFVKISER